MKRRTPTPTQERVRELLDYDPATGLLTKRQGSRSWKGTERKYGKVGAGRISELGYVMLTIDGHVYNAGAIAWLHTHGEWPARLKYLNGVKADNRLSNLTINKRDRDEVAARKLTHDRLKELLHYDPLTGWFTWCVEASMMKIGQRAGGLHGFGYRTIGIDYNKYLEHHLAWFYMTGEWPEFEIDHNNRKRDDNRWSNLVDSTKSQNGHNKGLHPSSTTGFPGVSAHGNGYRATISVAGTDYHLGRFGTIAEARVARLLGEIERFGHCTSWDDDRDTKLPSLGGTYVSIDLNSTEVRGSRADALCVYNHHGVPFTCWNVRTITGIIGARLEYDEEKKALPADYSVLRSLTPEIGDG
jgi:hypothetical protein